VRPSPDDRIGLSTSAYATTETYRARDPEHSREHHPSGLGTVAYGRVSCSTDPKPDAGPGTRDYASGASLAQKPHTHSALKGIISSPSLLHHLGDEASLGVIRHLPSRYDRAPRSL